MVPACGGMEGCEVVSVDNAKHHLKHHLPWLYKGALRVYRVTPHAKRRAAKMSAWEAREEDVARRLQARVEHESRIVERHLGGDWTVRHGSFSGMRFAPVLPNSLLSPKVIGSYEMEVHRWVEDAIDHGYDRILNIGCAEGYYAVGLALRSPTTTVLAYDTDARSQENTAALARLNGVAERIRVRGLCTHEELDREASDSTLILCDIEGGELDLLRPDLAPALLGADLIVETHEDYQPGVTDALVHRFLPSHSVEIVYRCARYAEEFPILRAVPAGEHALLLEEGRSLSQSWVRFLSNRPGAVKPVNWWPEK
jgi:hypothetical protein